MGFLSLAGGAARHTRALLAITVCFVVALHLVTADAALAISGYGSDTPAVAAQYPDSTANRMLPKPVISNLGTAIARSRKVLRSPDPQVRAQAKAEDAVIAQKTTHAIATAAGLGAPQSASIALLIAGVGVVALGVVLRWRRGAQI